MNSAMSFTLGVDPVTGAAIKVPTSDNPTIIKRKKKKTKKKGDKQTVKLAFKDIHEAEEEILNRKKSCHSKCKEDYETEKVSVSTKGRNSGLFYEPAYQGFGINQSGKSQGNDTATKRTKIKHKIDIVAFQ